MTINYEELKKYLERRNSENEQCMKESDPLGVTPQSMLLKGSWAENANTIFLIDKLIERNMEFSHSNIHQLETEILAERKNKKN